MNNTNVKLSELLEINPIEDSPLEKTELIETEIISKPTIDDDAEYARRNIRELIEKGSLAMDNLLHVARESEQPRAYEVAANMIKNLSELNKDLLEIQKRKKDLMPKNEPDKTVNIDKAVFIGSTAELLKQIKGLK